MFFVVMFGLLLAVVAVCGLCTASFFSVAFAAPQPAAGRAAKSRSLVAPLRAEGKLPVVTACKGNCRRCPSGRCQAGLRLIPVTPPEALAIADYLRHTQSTQQLDETLLTAVTQAGELAEHPATASPPGCALLAGDGHCLAGPVRPAACHVGLPEANALSGAAEPPGEASPQCEALLQGLRLSRLDMNPYELNGALAVALAMSDAADRWQRHEPIFSGCRKVT